MTTTDDATLVGMFETMALIAAVDDALRSAISAGGATLAYYSPRRLFIWNASGPKPRTINIPLP